LESLTLPQINTADSPAEIMNWKKKPEVRKCYHQPFKNNYKALVEIVDRVFGNKDYSNLQMAYIIAIYTTFLNPKNDNIRCKESSMKKKLCYYLVSFYSFFYFVIY
jgi:hypothetical protein